jgi:TPR repeat protein
VAQPTDESNVQILPDPELNPLLNPLLAAHMGRWAEVYFTSPPERRAQAVSDLVRELANNSIPEPIQSSPLSSHADQGRRMWEEVDDMASKVPPFSLHDAVDEPGFVRICESCGHRNGHQQRFCGMCGTPLAISSEDASQQPAEPAEAASMATAPWGEDPLASGRARDHEPEAANDSGAVAGDYEVAENQLWRPPEENPAVLSALSNYQAEAASHGYRIYIGAVVAILLVLLVYMTWRSNTALWTRGTAPPALPPAASVPTPQAAAEAPAAPAQVTPKGDLGPATAPPTSAAPQNNNAPATGLETDRRADRRVKGRPAPRVVPLTASSSAGAAERNGAAELAAAEKYLNAGPGTTRDSRQASTWLWKAVGKQNVTATLLLSDLYLRGDGVPKSCDQARLLLDAAARKGATTAAERLRNLQAFGCR